eukprot:1186480-Prorocentrum_minimum.AAC.7
MAEPYADGPVADLTAGRALLDTAATNDGSAGENGLLGLTRQRTTGQTDSIPDQLVGSFRPDLRIYPRPEGSTPIETQSHSTLVAGLGVSLLTAAYVTKVAKEAVAGIAGPVDDDDA